MLLLNSNTRHEEWVVTDVKVGWWLWLWIDLCKVEGERGCAVVCHCLGEFVLDNDWVHHRHHEGLVVALWQNIGGVKDSPLRLAILIKTSSSVAGLRSNLVGAVGLNQGWVRELGHHLGGHDGNLGRLWLLDRRVYCLCEQMQSDLVS